MENEDETRIPLGEFSRPHHLTFYNLFRLNSTYLFNKESHYVEKFFGSFWSTLYFALLFEEPWDFSWQNLIYKCHSFFLAKQATLVELHNNLEYKL